MHYEPAMDRFGIVILLGTVILVVLTGCGGEESNGFLDRLEATANASPWVIILLLALATVTSEDVACVTAGVLVAQGTFPYSLAVAGCLLGIVCSDVSLFLLGKWLGEPVVKYPPFSWFVTPGRLDLGKRLYRHYGGGLVITSRFLPGTRMLAYIAAGMLGYSWKRFIIYMAVACSVWTPALVGFAMLFGGVVLQWIERYQRWAMIGVPLAVLLALLVLRSLFRLMNVWLTKQEDAA